MRTTVCIISPIRRGAAFLYVPHVQYYMIYICAFSSRLTFIPIYSIYILLPHFCPWGDSSSSRFVWLFFFSSSSAHFYFKSEKNIQYVYVYASHTALFKSIISLVARLSLLIAARSNEKYTYTHTYYKSSAGCVRGTSLSPRPERMQETVRT